jgi:3',5'-cyclic AMP phosphodiesterase CpdA
MEKALIAQISDIHVENEGTFPYGVDVRKNFLAVLSAVVDESPQLIVLTGDLCYKTVDPDIYAWVRTRLESAGIPYIVLPGIMTIPPCSRSPSGTMSFFVPANS